MATLSDLLPYQHQMIEHLKEHEKCALWVAMGSGKTVTTLTAVQWMLQNFEANKVLVIAPLRVARKVWTDEIETWDHLNLTTSIMVGSYQNRVAAMRTPADIHIINRENVSWLIDRYMRGQKKPWPWDTVVIDESRSFKNPTSGRFRQMRRILPQVSRMIQLTGTPAANGLQDLWAQLYLLDNGERLEPYVTHFYEKYFDVHPYSKYKRKLKPGAERAIIDKVKDICLSLRDEDLHGAPTVQRTVVRCYLPDIGRRVYDDMKTKQLAEFADAEIPAVSAGVLVNKLVQLANGAVYTEEKHWVATHSAKIETLVELVAERDGPMIVVYQYIHDKERILAAFEQENRKVAKQFSYRLLQTEKDEDDWNAGKIDVLLLHPASAGHGLNLHKSGAKRIVHFSINPDLDQYLQVNARLFGGHRGKGRQGVIMHIVANDTIDERIMGMLREKTETQDSLMRGTSSQRMIELANEMLKESQGDWLL